ncbi:glycosyltransferase [Paraflavisolibacter sp. H34]|uniref:glycosyltransferase family 2 protein n=1 Tax=Huijunlia imazamoxiresistens TaxID=3127457 RepID=UPI003016DDAC
MMPLVSVIVPTYNSSKYILETLHAIRSQTLQDFEIVVVDDCSSDNTLDLIRGLNDPRIRIYVNEQNRGIPYTHNRLIELCTTDYIAVQDHDDLSYPDRLERQYQYLRQHPAALATASYPNYIDEEGRPIFQPALRKLLRILKLNNAGADSTEVFPFMFFKNIFCHSTLMYNKKNLGDIRYQPQFAICDDYDILCRVAAVSPVAIDPRPVLQYRVHRRNTSSQRFKERERDVNEVQGRYLRQLGIEPSPANLFLHNGFFNDLQGFRPSVDYLQKSLEWYRTIEEKNRQAQLFDSRGLQKAIETNWFERCLACRSMGLKLLPLYFRGRAGKRAVAGRTARLVLLFFSIFFYRD